MSERYPPEPQADPPGDIIVGRCTCCRGELYRSTPGHEGLCRFCAAVEDDISDDSRKDGGWTNNIGRRGFCPGWMR